MAQPSPWIAIVDDDPSVAPLLQKMLVGHGYRVVASRVVAAAVADARRVQPAAILIDLRIREGDGTDLLRELKSDPSTRDIPVIIMSATDPGDVPDEVGGYLSKPVQQNTLLRTLDEHADASKADR
jgi:CheY-like chemotaxis protein